MNCKETQEVIDGYLDSELDVVHNLAVEQHLQECAVCARSFEGFESLRKVMASRSLYFEAPKGLEKRLRSAVRLANKAESPRWSSEALAVIFRRSKRGFRHCPRQISSSGRSLIACQQKTCFAS